jgi:alkylhydroperoxidase/carboxymuconolactone decarboxylase family protein YurZ
MLSDSRSGFAAHSLRTPKRCHHVYRRTHPHRTGVFLPNVWRKYGSRPITTNEDLPRSGCPSVPSPVSAKTTNDACTEYFSIALAYGYTYAFPEVLSPMETSFVMVAALIASDTPRQIDWHLKGAMRNGASRAQVQAVRQISIVVASAAGVSWKGDIPDIES